MGNKSCSAEDGLTWGHAPPENFQIRVLEMRFPAFSAGHFQQNNMQQDAVVGCLFYFSLVLSVRYSVYRKKGQ